MLVHTRRLVMLLFVVLIVNSLFGIQAPPSSAAPCGLTLPANSTAMPGQLKVMEAHRGSGRTLEGALVQTPVALDDVAALIRKQAGTTKLADFAPYKTPPATERDQTARDLLDLFVQHAWTEVPTRWSGLPEYLRGTAVSPPDTTIRLTTGAFLLADSVCVVMMMSPHLSEEGDKLVPGTMVWVRRTAPWTGEDVK
jgi:hypothetical protein